MDFFMSVSDCVSDCVDAFLEKIYNERMKKPISKTSKFTNPRKKLSPEVREALDVYHTEMKNHIEALSENFQHGLSAVAEQYSGLNKKIDVLGDEMKEVKAKLDMHTEMIGVIMEDVTVLKDDVAVLKDDVAILKTDVSEIKDELKNKADKTEVIHLSRRVSVFEHIP